MSRVLWALVGNGETVSVDTIDQSDEIRPVMSPSSWTFAIASLTSVAILWCLVSRIPCFRRRRQSSRVFSGDGSCSFEGTQASASSRRSSLELRRLGRSGGVLDSPVEEFRSLDINRRQEHEVEMAHRSDDVIIEVEPAAHNNSQSESIVAGHSSMSSSVGSDAALLSSGSSSDFMPSRLEVKDALIGLYVLSRCGWGANGSELPAHVYTRIAACLGRRHFDPRPQRTITLGHEELSRLMQQILERDTDSVTSYSSSVGSVTRMWKGLFRLWSF
eukprot:TRINITY_DN31519_c0_g1_i1.p1 TRINITY_DN31519_c0_g1~~TRINITY_DN31519_c0_g1_i1.p1  ORF type:complete len:274 (-),score=9.22 TRINITY_DN31519_c0_g1_i1:407-1228(-)